MCVGICGNLNYIKCYYSDEHQHPLKGARGERFIPRSFFITLQDCICQQKLNTFLSCCMYKHFSHTIKQKHPQIIKSPSTNNTNYRSPRNNLLNIAKTQNVVGETALHHKQNSVSLPAMSPFTIK